MYFNMLFFYTSIYKCCLKNIIINLFTIKYPILIDHINNNQQYIMKTFLNSLKFRNGIDDKYYLLYISSALISKINNDYIKNKYQILLQIYRTSSFYRWFIYD